MRLLCKDYQLECVLHRLLYFTKDITFTYLRVIITVGVRIRDRIRVKIIISRHVTRHALLPSYQLSLLTLLILNDLILQVGPS